MTENNKSFRIRTNIGEDKSINLNINQDYDILEILSLKISTENFYKLHTANYGCVVGRVLANGGVGVPNAKISIFIEASNDITEDAILTYLYPYNDIYTKNEDGIRYNLLPNEQVMQCHQQVGSFPNKRLVLDDNNVLEVFDKYYKYTTVSNDAGDYMLFGVPVGEQTLHMDLDLSDIGILSQKPIDLTYKGYNITQFESASRFKKDANLDNLTQIISQNKTINVSPFWGDTDEGEIKITRNDINVDYKFEPTCIFMGSIISDNKSNAFNKKCVPTVDMGRMDKMTTGNGTIEMIRKKPDGSVEEYSIQGNELIDGNGTWCYQIPMNLDYVATDEYGNLVPTDNPEKGIATRTRVRFRISLSDFESDYINNHLTKILVPHNPKNLSDIDYVFGTDTKDKEDGTGSFRDLFWNNVYTVKSYIPRIQKGNNQRTNKFTGFKNVNVYGNNNPIPYNNMRVNISFMFILQCAIMKCLIFFCKVYNWAMDNLPGLSVWKKKKRKCAYIGDGLCPDLEGWYFAPGCTNGRQMNNSFNDIKNKEGYDEKSIDYINKDNETICITNEISYFTQCLEVNLAMENEVIKFDFYNDWINGLIYIPRWFVNIRKKKSFLFGLIKIKPKVQACLEESFRNSRRLTQQCSLSYAKSDTNSYIYDKTTTPNGCKSYSKQKCHKTSGRSYVKIFKGNPGGGIVHDERTYMGQSVYYPRPVEWIGERKCNLFATDIVLLGNLNSCNQYGIPKMIDRVQSSTYQLPPNLVQTNMDSDGALYGVSGRRICTNKAIYQEIEPFKQTFRDYITWSKGQEFFESKPDDIDEYGVTELSGIDWGVSGPGQGGHDMSKLSFPGGHFLGIACTNAQVNIKSCVNLSRICEFGSLMSQRQYKVVSKSDEYGNYYEYVYIVPTGFISKDEISDDDYRNVFSTLNQNGLKTIVANDGLRKYEFITMTPINYNGSLSEKVKNDAYNSVTIEGEGSSASASAFTRTIEDNSKDYYDFRMGVITEDDKKNIKNKYLLNRGTSVGMPVYENSFYFYFGKTDGNTAVDRFFKEYYASCNSIFSDDEPSVDVSVENRIACQEKGGSVNFSIKNIPLPYSYKLYKDDRLYGDDYQQEFYFGNEIIINGLTNGSYYLNIKNDLHGINIIKEFNITTELPSEGANLTTENYAVSSTNFSSTPYITIYGGVKKIKISGKNADSFIIEGKIVNESYYEDGEYFTIIESLSGNSYRIPKENQDISDHTYNNYEILSGPYNIYSHSKTYGIDGTIEITLPNMDNSKNGPYPKGFIIVGDGFYVAHNINDYIVGCALPDILGENYAKNYGSFNVRPDEDLQYTNRTIIEEKKNDDSTTYKLRVWSENSSYGIYIVYSCSNVSDLQCKNNDYGFVEHGDEYVGVENQVFDYYVYDESVHINELDRRGFIVSGATRTNSGVSDLVYKDEDGETIKEERGATWFEIDVNKIINGGESDNGSLTDAELWKIKKTLTFNKTIHEPNNKHSISVGVIHGSGNLNELTIGQGETITGDENGYITVSNINYKNQSAAEADGYSLDLNNISVPTDPWRKKSIVDECNNGDVVRVSGRNPYFYRAEDNGEPLEIKGKKNLKLNLYYRPFIYNAVLVLAPEDTFDIRRVKHSEDVRFETKNNYKLCFVPKYEDVGYGEKAINSGDSSKCNSLFYYTISNGCTIKKNNAYFLGEMRLNVNFDTNIIHDKNYRTKDELQIQTGVTIFDGNYDISNYNGSYIGQVGSGYPYELRTTYNENEKYIKKIDAKNVLNFSLEVDEYSLPVNDLIGDTIGSYYNGIMFYDTITIGDGSNQKDENGNIIKVENENGQEVDKFISNNNHYVVTGNSSKGVRYYFMNAADLASFISACSNINTSFSDGPAKSAGWQSIWTRQNLDGSRIFYNEITDRLVSARLYDYDNTTNYTGKNSGLDPTAFTQKDVVVGIYDEYTQLGGKYNDVDSEYGSEVSAMRSSIPADSIRFSIVKLYRVSSFEKGSYEDEYNWGGK